MSTLSSLARCLIVVLACITPTVTKHCFYCDFTNSNHCIGAPMYCGEEEDCYVGHGTATGLAHIMNKGCVAVTSCGKEEPLNYMEVTYNFIIYCCQGNLCNAGPTGPKQAPSSFTTIIAGLSLTVLTWML
uniref:Sperm acrosome membrane-associated protein 4-like n=1 Tax=Phascolarctos cinereus TaxID=38626 RepID=A0A6P5KW95_PHACI|nr:sperm acrosome membrane-associated protein 4-like [Phascolarctos cinereus]